jgi:hypothetical protein
MSKTDGTEKYVEEMREAAPHMNGWVERGHFVCLKPLTHQPPSHCQMEKREYWKDRTP